MKNLDERDPKKDDPTIDPAVGATQRSCRIRATNKSAQTLTKLTLKHTSGKNITTILMPELKNGQSSYEKEITFETGSAPYYDYWNISFYIGTKHYNTPWNDRCNISYEDAGKLVDCIVTKSGSNYNLNTHTPVSSGCNFVIKEN